MKTFKLVVRGRTPADVELAIAASMRLIGSGMLSGHDRNEDGSLSFTSEGEYGDEDGQEAATVKMFHKATGKVVVVGDAVTDFRGDAAIVTGWQAPHREGSSGRIHVRYKDDATGEAEYYPSVFNCEFRIEP